MILLIDNYDSFTYNLYQAVGVLTKDITVARNDEITIDEIEKMSPAAIIISPGPGYPKDAGISEEVIKTFSGRIPISIRWKDSSRKAAASRQADRYQS